MKSVREIENIMVEAIRYRAKGCDIINVDGTRYARLYHYGCPSEHGGSAIAAEINITGLAVDLERALS